MKSILVSIVFLLIFSTCFSQVQVYTKAQADSAIAAAIKKIVFPSASLDNSAVQKMIDISLSKLDSLVVKQKQSTGISFIALDTIKTANNTTVQFDLIVTAVLNSNQTSWSSPWHVMLSNVNGVYTIQRQAQPLAQSGLFLSGLVVSLGVDKDGMKIFATPNTVQPITWTVMYSPKKISK